MCGLVQPARHPHRRRRAGRRCARAGARGERAVSVLLADASGADPRDGRSPHACSVLRQPADPRAPRRGSEVTPATPIGNPFTCLIAAPSDALYLNAAEGRSPSARLCGSVRRTATRADVGDSAQLYVTLAAGARATQRGGRCRVGYAEFEDNGSNREVRARLAVVADGGATSQALTRVNIRDYGQSAIAANVLSVETARQHRLRALHSSGPARLASPREEGYALGLDHEPRGGAQLPVRRVRTSFLGAVAKQPSASAPARSRTVLGPSCISPLALLRGSRRPRREPCCSAMPRRRCIRWPDKGSTSGCATPGSSANASSRIQAIPAAARCSRPMRASALAATVPEKFC